MVVVVVVERERERESSYVSRRRVLRRVSGVSETNPPASRHSRHSTSLSVIGSPRFSFFGRISALSLRDFNYCNYHY